VLGSRGQSAWDQGVRVLGIKGSECLILDQGVQSNPIQSRKFDTHLGADARNTAINGFWAKTGHLGIHTNKFFLALGEASAGMMSEASTIKVMQNLAKRVDSGEFVKK